MADQNPHNLPKTVVKGEHRVIARNALDYQNLLSRGYADAEPKTKAPARPSGQADADK